MLTELLDSEELKDFVEDLTRRIYAELDEFIQVFFSFFLFFLSSLSEELLSLLIFDHRNLNFL